MKYEDIKNLKADDKIVIKLEPGDAGLSNGLSSENEDDLVDHLFAKRQYLGKLSDFANPDKIVFAEEEKAEFDRLTQDNFNKNIDDFEDIQDLLNHTAHAYASFPKLNSYLYGGAGKDNIKHQIAFARAVEHPELIEVKKEKRYRLKVLDSYICHDVEDDTYCFGEKHVNTGIENVFIQSEIDELQELSEFDSIDLSGCKEAVEDESGES